MSADTPSDGSDGIARQDAADSAARATPKRRNVLRGAAGAAAAVIGVSGAAAASDGAGTEDYTFCTYQCIDGTCGCRKYYVDTTFNTCYDYDEWCCTGCTGCEDDCPYS
jgi:hypothetical protein